MSNLLIALLALDIGVSLSKVFIFTWKSNYLEQKKQLFSKTRNSEWVLFIWSIYFIKYKIKPTKELPTSSSTIKSAINFANPININPNFL